MGERRYSSTILDLGTRWKCVVSFTSLPLTPTEKSPRCPLSRWFAGVGAPEVVWTLWSREKSLASARNRISDTQPITCSYTDCAIQTSTLDWYSSGTGFDSRFGERLSWQIFRYVLSQVLGQWAIVASCCILPNLQTQSRVKSTYIK
jgi:hypothetical protein